MEVQIHINTVFVAFFMLLNEHDMLILSQTNGSPWVLPVNVLENLSFSWFELQSDKYCAVREVGE